jgi:integrase
MKGTTFRRCGCRDQTTKRKYPEGKCPRLNSNKRADQDHGNWWGRFDAPRGADQRRRQIRVGPFDNEADAETAIAAEIARIGAGGHVTDRKLKVGDYLKTWLEGKRSLKPKTLSSYEETVRLYFIPALGYLRLCDLRDHHISDLVTALGQINRPLPEGEKPSELLLRLLDVRADEMSQVVGPGEKRRKRSTRPLSPARIKRVMAVLNSALNTAVRGKLLASNPAENVELPRLRGKGKSRPMVWTKPRVQRWLATGRVPGPVMVWTPRQTGAFLDFIVDERLYALYHVTAFRGLRRAESVGLPWAEVDLEEALLTVIETLSDDGHDDPDDPKSDAGTRTMSLDPGSVDVIIEWQDRQEQERQQSEAAWIDSGRVFTQPDGRPLRPGWISERFDALIRKYNAIQSGYKLGKAITSLARRHRVSEEAVKLAVNGEPLPPIRFHGLRHGAATLSLAAGVDMKVISETLGHSKSSFTSDVYTSVIPEVAQAAAEAVASIVPRSRQRDRRRSDDEQRPDPD